MGYFYFAGNSLASMRATRDLAIKHELIWRPPGPGLPRLQDGDRILLCFWPGRLDSRQFVPLAMFEASAARPQVSQGRCFTTIPQGIRQEFLQAERGDGGTGYRREGNPDFVAVSLRRVRCPDLDAHWAASGGRLLSYGFDRGATGRRAFWAFDSRRLLNTPAALPRSMWPV